LAFRRKLKVAGYMAILILSMGVKSCKKEISNETEYQKIMQQQFESFSKRIGDVDLSTIKYAYNGDSKLYILTALVKGSEDKKYILYVDKRESSSVKYKKFIFESNIPSKILPENEKLFNGFAQFTSLDKSEVGIRVEFINGLKTVREFNAKSYTNVRILETNELEENNESTFGSPLTDCIKRVLRNMSIGEWVLFIATEPESVAGLILACAIDVYIIN
jgi:hypothetical protein